MEFVEQLKASVDIVKVIGEYVPLRKAGPNRYVGRCPFHTEKTPSFSVSSQHQYYKCFGCDAKGDVIKFVRDDLERGLPAALKDLAESNGIPMPVRQEYHNPESKLRNALYEMHEIAARAFRANLSGPVGSEARAYLKKRGLSAAAIEHFELGMSDKSGQEMVKQLRQFPADQLEVSGLVGTREGGGYYDRFRGRLMFPIHDESGKVIGFGGRALGAGEEPKYLNSPETAIYKKSTILYNLHRAKDAIRKADKVVLVEGYMDVIGVYSAGVRNVIASCGTALTSGQVRSARRHSENMVVNFDPDTAGANATERSIQMLLDERMHVRVLALDGGLDPDEYIKKFGAETYLEKLEMASGYFLWLAERARKKFDMRTSEGRIAGLKFLLPAIERISDKLERAMVAGEVADYLGIDRGLVLDEFRKTAIKGPARQAARPAPALSMTERILIRSLVADTEVREVLVPRLRTSPILENFACRGILAAIFALHDSSPEFTFHELEGRLDEALNSLLAETVLADNTEEVFTREQADSYLRMLEGEERKAAMGALRMRLKQAERNGDMKEAFRLMQEMTELGRRIEPGI
ncbi:MAG: DNA primase [Bryobacteraceae bacterium]